MNKSLSITLSGSPLGIGWGFLYGYQEVPAITFLPELRQLKAGLTKIYLFWNQVEPERGRYDWRAVDAFISQLESPEEGLIALFSSSLWAVQRPAALLPPSPARDPDDYYRFVFELVQRCQGRVRYWQNDAEPNNPIFWSGTKEAFIAQLKVFYQAVKDADPEALVVVGGYDGLFNPPGMHPFPNQEKGLDFFEAVLRDGSAAFDLFDMRLYNDPYTIPTCVDFMRQKMIALGYEKPFLCTEYGGPGFFAFAENRQYLPLVASWSQSGLRTNEHGLPSEDTSGKHQIEALYQNMPALAPQTQMFMQDCPPEYQAKYERIQARELVIRTVLALSAGVQKLIYWQLLAGRGQGDDLMDLMYGKIGMLEFVDGVAAEKRPVAAVYKRLAELLTGISKVEKIEDGGRHSIYMYKVYRQDQHPLFIIWERRDAFSGDEQPPAPLRMAWEAPGAFAVDALGQTIPVEFYSREISLGVTDMPIYLEPV
jgi:hypothetical protein